MKKALFFTLCISIILLTLTGCNRQNIIEKKSNEKKWYLDATYHEGCSCHAPCPCPFGLPMTNSYCKLNGLLVIHEGRYQNTDLSGLKAILSGSVGSTGEYYFTETISDKQKNALEKILKKVNITAFDTIVKSEKTTINYTKTEKGVTYSTSKINVELNTVIGANNKPVVVNNLNGKAFVGYIPHLAIVNERKYQDSLLNFSFPNKAGFTAKWDFSNIDFK